MRYRTRHALFIILLCSLISCTPEKAINKWETFTNEATFPIQMHTNSVYTFDSLHIAFQNMELSLQKGKMIPLECELGTTGMVIFSIGSLKHYNNTTINKGEVEIKDFVFMRFNPEDIKLIVNLSNFKKTKETEVYNKAWKIVGQYFKYSYSNGYEAIIPDKGCYSIIFDKYRIEFDAKTNLNKVDLLKNL